MDIQQIIKQLKQERDRLDKAIEALSATATSEGRPGGRRRTMSPAARKRVSAMMKKRWAAQKRASRRDDDWPGPLKS